MQDLADLFEPIRQIQYEGKPLTGIHVNWNAPKGKPQPPWEVLLGILSACYWTSYNGPIDLYTDEIGLKNVERLGLKGLYRNVKLLDSEMTSGLDPETFWAAGKFIAMLECDEPACFLDQDILFTKKLPQDPNVDIRYLHREIVHTMWYPNKIRGFVSKHYGYPETNFAYNCALVGFTEVDTMRSYASESMRFINNAPKSIFNYPSEAIMCSIEQYGLQQFTSSKNLVAQPLITSIYNPEIEGLYWEPNENGFYDIEEVHEWIYHEWAGKAEYRKDRIAALEFSLKIVGMLEKKLGVSLEPLLQKLDFTEH
jgi:hypothetical protein